MEGADQNLWKKDLAPCRRPKSDNKEATPAESNATESILTKSKLSADAKEFVPRAAPPSANNKSSVQSRLSRQAPPANHVDVQPDLQANEYETFLENEIGPLREAIDILTSNPGKFDEIAPHVVDSLAHYANVVSIIEHVITVIVNKAITEHNFGYSGARLCATLRGYSDHLLPTLIHFCETLRIDPGFTEHARNFTLFLAELYSQLDWNSSFGVCLLKSIDMLLTRNAPEDIKCICQTLKLTGMSLETLDGDSVNSIIKRLEERQSNVPSSYAALLQSVLNLRASNWGGGVRPPSSVPISPTLSDYPPEAPFAQRWSDGGPVFYGPDGHELSAEENAFLTDVSDEIAPEDLDQDTLWDPNPDIDEEIQAAFKKFIKMGKQ